MALKIYARHGGAAAASQDDITARIPFLDGVPGTPIVQMGMGVQNGESSQGTMLVPDPTANDDASLYFPPHTQITLTSDATGDELMLAQGRITTFEIGRATGSEIEDAVEWTLNIQDANADLRGLAFTEDWVRPAESGYERLVALAAYTLNGTSSTRPDVGGVITYRPSTAIVVDTSHLAPDTNTIIMPAKTYPAGTQPQDVANDCATTEGKVYGVVPHHSGGASHLCLLYVKESDHSTYSSAVKISDQLADWDPDDLIAPVFEPIWDQGKGQTVDGNANISGLVNRYGPDAAVVVSVDETLGDANEYWVDVYQDGDSVDPTQAANRAASIIAYRSPFSETDSLSIEMLPEQHHLITAGMSIQVKTAVVAAGTTSTLGTYVDRRIVSLIWEPRSNGKLHAILSLNRPAGKGFSSGSSQPKSTTPQPAPGGGCIDSFNRIVLAGAWGTGEWGVPWTVNLDIGIGAGDPELARLAFSVNGSEGQKSLLQQVGAPIDTISTVEVVKAWTLPADVRLEGTITDVGTGADSAYAVIEVPFDDSRFYRMMTWTFGDYHVTFWASANNPGDGQVTYAVFLSDDLAGTEVQYATFGDIPDPPFKFMSTWISNFSTAMPWACSIHIQSDGVTATASGSSGVTGGVTISGTPVAPSILNFESTKLAGFPEDFIVTVDQIVASGDCAGSSSFWTRLDDPRLIPALDYDLGFGDGATTLFTVAPAPYLPGTLQVWVDGLEQTFGTTETDPAAGTFTLGFAPLASERIRVAYRNG